MKKLLALALVVMVAGGALAQTDQMMGMFFVNDVSVIHANMPDDGTAHPNTNVDITAPVDAYVVLLYPTVDSVGGYEVGILIDGPAFVLDVGGPNGWTNFGNNTNHLVGYQTPLPVGEYGVVLSTMNVFPQGAVLVSFGQADPPSIPGTPVIADGADPDILIAVPPTTPDGIVASFNGGGVVAVEERTLSGVKALFE